MRSSGRSARLRAGRQQHPTHEARRIKIRTRGLGVHCPLSLPILRPPVSNLPAGRHARSRFSANAAAFAPNNRLPTAHAAQLSLWWWRRLEGKTAVRTHVIGPLASTVPEPETVPGLIALLSACELARARCLCQVSQSPFLGGSRRARRHCQPRLPAECVRRSWTCPVCVFVWMRALT